MITIAKHKVEITGINTSEIKVLTDKEKEALFIRLKNGDMAAKEELANGNLKFQFLESIKTDVITWMIYFK